MSKIIAAAALACLSAAAACTTLGPMPATTGISAIPTDRPGVEVQAAAVPAYYLSGAATDQRGTAVGQLSALVEPDRLLGVKGLILGGRAVGASGDAVWEPYIGWRHHLSPGASFAVVGYGTIASATQSYASYRATRLGGEVALDGRLLDVDGWFSLHAQGSLSATSLSVTGTYCVGQAGEGIDCTGDTSDHVVDAKLSGIYPAANAQLSVDLTGRAAGMRLAVLGSAGEMPTLVGGTQRDARSFASLGVALTLRFGARH